MSKNNKKNNTSNESKPARKERYDKNLSPNEELLIEIRRYRIYPDEEQDQLILQTIGCCRKYWNNCLADSQFIYDEYGIRIYPNRNEYYDECPYFQNVDSHAFDNVQANLRQAMDDYFKGKKSYPKFKSKRKELEGRAGYTTNNCVQVTTNKNGETVVNNSIEIADGKIKLPKLSWVKANIHREPPANSRITQVSIQRDSNGTCYASITFKKIVPKHDIPFTQLIDLAILDVSDIYAMDYSSPALFVDENGDIASIDGVFGYVFPRKRLERIMVHVSDLQRKLRRKEKGSKNYVAIQEQISGLHAHAANLRKDFLDKISCAISKHYRLVCVEDLNLKAMAKRKGFHLGKSTYANGWCSFVSMLEYKCAREGGKLVKVGRFYPSSKTCSHCGHKHDGLKLSDRVFVCPECGAVMLRDENAAANIHNEGVRLAFSGFGAPVPRKFLIKARSFTNVEECSNIYAPGGTPGCALPSGDQLLSLGLASQVSALANLALREAVTEGNGCMGIQNLAAPVTDDTLLSVKSGKLSFL